MNLHLGYFAAVGILLALISSQGSAQNLPGTLSFSVSGAFQNGVSQSSGSLLIADNDLTNGYNAGMDQTDAPSSLNPTGPVGSASFQWGDASTTSSYPHTSALWFEPIPVTNAIAEQYFNLGNLYYRNGTIKTTTGATSVDLALNLSFSNPSSLPPISTSFTSDLINSVNSSDPIASADIVSLRNLAAPLSFSDASGKRYYLELTFQVDKNTIDGTLSTPKEFRVFEGGQGSAQLLGRFTTSPTVEAVPEPSTALLGALGIALCLRRKR